MAAKHRHDRSLWREREGTHLAAVAIAVNIGALAAAGAQRVQPTLVAAFSVLVQQRHGAVDHLAARSCRRKHA